MRKLGQKLNRSVVDNLVGKTVVAVLCRYGKQCVGIVGEVYQGREDDRNVYDIFHRDGRDRIDGSARLYPFGTCRKEGSAETGEGHFKHGTVVELDKDGKPKNIFSF
jgi:hypothetical protein